MSSYSSMTHNPLVEAVALAGMREEYRNYGLTASTTPIAYNRHIRIATAALRAIEDAGYTIIPTAAPSHGAQP